MAADPLLPVASGQPLEISAETYNEWCEAARRDRVRRLGPGGGAGGITSITPSLTVIVRNDTGANLAAFSIVKLTGKLGDLTTLPYPFRDRPVFTADTPGSSSDVIAILYEPILNGALGRATVVGVSICSILINNSSDKWAAPINGDNTRLTSGSSGPARVVWSAGSSGTQTSIVILGDGITGIPPNGDSVVYNLRCQGGQLNKYKSVNGGPEEFVSTEGCCDCGGGVVNCSFCNATIPATLCAKVCCADGSSYSPALLKVGSIASCVWIGGGVTVEFDNTHFLLSTATGSVCRGDGLNKVQMVTDSCAPPLLVHYYGGTGSFSIWVADSPANLPSCAPPPAPCYDAGGGNSVPAVLFLTSASGTYANSISFNAGANRWEGHGFFLQQIIPGDATSWKLSSGGGFQGGITATYSPFNAVFAYAGDTFTLKSHTSCSGGGSILTDCCPVDALPNVLHGTFTGFTGGCACLNGQSIVLTYQTGSEACTGGTGVFSSWRGTILSGCFSTTCPCDVLLDFFCESGSWTVCFHFDVTACCMSFGTPVKNPSSMNCATPQFVFDLDVTLLPALPCGGADITGVLTVTA